MDQQIDLRDIGNCTCARLRRASRRVTQLYDAHLAPAGLTIAQFGLLATVSSATAKRADGIALGELAERMVMDPTTLSRNLRPLETRGLLRSAPLPSDRRVRAVRMTAAGTAALVRARPLWRAAQQEVETALGSEPARDLRAMLDRSVRALGATATVRAPAS
jgi:DNA-binding MarR family transcriptional regulator